MFSTLQHDDGLDELVERAAARERRALGRLVTLFESTHPDAPRNRRRVLHRLDQLHLEPRARTIGVTGTPGAGKSSLIAAAVEHLLRRHPTLTVAALAVDPSSAASHGSLLGDRTRMTVSDSDRFYFRSQASRLDLGGLSRVTFSVCRLLSRLFDLVLVETVGVGQSEIDVCEVADATAVVMPPLGGDHVQWMKAGIMEIPDLIVLNKCDQTEAANRAWHSLRSALGLAQPGHKAPPRVLRTSTLSGQGIDEFVDWLLVQPYDPVNARRARFFLRRWVLDEYGRDGLRRFDASEAHARWLQTAPTDFETVQEDIRFALEHFRRT